MVFRPSGTQLPRARGGRASLELAPEGRLCHRTSGPDDRRVETPGTWTLDGDELVLEKEGGRERYRVDHLDEQQLVLRRLG
jgi:hypothetical protein